MADTVDLVNWSGQKGVSFYLKSKEIRGVKDINISASLDTEDNEADSEKYTKKKNAGSYQITLTAVLNAALGVNVKEVAIAMTEAARQGKSGYFYMSTKKLFPSQFMATDAKITNLRLTRKGKWSYAEVEFTLKQCSKYDGTPGTSSSSSSSSSSGGGGGGGTTKEYKVQIPGMSVVTVKATSVQGAITQAVGSSWTGTVYVDGTSYYVVKGKISVNPNTVKNVVNTVTNAVKTTVNNVKNAISNFFGGLSAAKTQSNNVMKDANTKKTGGTSTNTGLKLNLKNVNLLK